MKQFLKYTLLLILQVAALETDVLAFTACLSSDYCSVH